MSQYPLVHDLIIHGPKSQIACSHSSMSSFKVGKGNLKKGSLVNNHDHGNICSLSRYPRIY